ncbi:MAG: flagellar modification protein B [Oligoflexales bacterium]
MKRLCSICARGGSQGVQGKNLRPLLGKPLLLHSLEQAHKSGLFSAIAVSSDDEGILEEARKFGVDVIVSRPESMATSTAAKVPAIQHCAKTSELILGVEFDTFVDLDATSPLRQVEDIQGAVHLLEEQGADNVLTGSPARRSPYFNLVERQKNGLTQLVKPGHQVVRRQDAPDCFDLNASIYVWKRSALLSSDISIFHDKTLLYEMPEERSWDIDSEFDWRIVSMLAAERGRL